MTGDKRPRDLTEALNAIAELRDRVEAIEKAAAPVEDPAASGWQRFRDQMREKESGR